MKSDLQRLEGKINLLSQHITDTVVTKEELNTKLDKIKLSIWGSSVAQIIIIIGSVLSIIYMLKK